MAVRPAAGTDQVLLLAVFKVQLAAPNGAEYSVKTKHKRLM
jgi:hypothetical protein